MTAARTRRGPAVVAVGAGQWSVAIRRIVARCHAPAVRSPERVAVVDEDRSLTFADLWRDAYKVAARSQPVPRGTVQQLLSRPQVQLFVRMLAAWLADTTPMPAPLGTPPAAVTVAVQAATGSGGHSGGPWLAHGSAS
ncbi:hypothetical protein [Dactylosporangium sp. CA-139066]|uniref:hypothetical protein n=1 Tax=Dactylosporangium sp. CA-139066 TaxID=3239930 RepID=UPI003D94AE10